ncbi:YneF family protein [Paenibacillus taiwanensis]|uniref:YneF family protein n=1 Tax=Paenibacillus taiwanensis TaxID=401638 RepID=UPI00041AF8B4|nr:YneF family protein [Paenibacillus taiwanensis]
MWITITAIVCLIVGAVAGFAGGVYYLRNQMTKMQSDPAMLQKMAKQMGYNLNSKQMQQAQKMMSGNAGMPGKGNPGKKFKR